MANNKELMAANQDIEEAIQILSNNQEVYTSKKTEIEKRYNKQHDFITDKCKTFSEKTKDTLF